MSIRAAQHRTPAPLTPGYGTQALSGAKAYYRSLNKPLAIGGSVLLIGALLAQLLPPVVRSSNVFNGALAGVLGLYSIIGFLFLRTKFRITLPALILGLIQLWIVATVFLGPSVFGLEMKVGRNIWWPTFVLMPYLATFVLVAIDPRWRERLLNFILGVSLLVAFVALLQFLKFPGAYALSNYYADLADLKSFGLDKRSHGLSTHPFHLSAQCILGCGIVASRLLFRKLTAWDILFYAVLSSGIIVAQARSFYVAWLIITLITLGFIFRRDLAQFLIIVCLMGSIIAGLVVAFPEQLSYGISGKNTIADGRMDQWTRADELSAEFPITGIGPKETVFGSGKDFSGRGRWWSLYTESGYRMSRVSGGFIGLALLISLVGSCLFLAWRVARDQLADPARRRAAFAGFYYMIAITLGLYITNIVENELITYYGMALAGIVAPQVHEVYNGQRGKTKKFLNRFAAAKARMELNARNHEVANS